MSQNFNPSRSSGANRSYGKHGYVATLVQLPTACARCEGNVVFCDEDKRFYDCMHVVTETEDFYRWTAVTAGAQRSYLIPVEKLITEEIPDRTDELIDVRTNSFDAIASALNEISIGLFRYNIIVEPLCYVHCNDTRYIAGKDYYVWNNNYDRAAYVVTEDATPKVGKIYYVRDIKWNYISVTFEEGEEFEEGITYYESTRPIFIKDPDYEAGKAIDHRVFLASGKTYDQLTKPDLVNKTNELINIINITNAQVPKALDDGTGSLFDLCRVINMLIDEVNPFSVPWNQLLDRVTALERAGHAGSEDIPIELPLYFLKKVVVEGVIENRVYSLDIYDNEKGKGVIIDRVR